MVLGHQYGDSLLKEVAARFSGCVRQADTLSRIGGDEFALILPDAGFEQAEAVARKIAGVIAEPFLAQGHKICVGMSTGIALYPEHGQTSDTLLQHANIAMCEAKRSDVDYALFDSDQDTSSWPRLVLIGQLREAIAQNQLFLHYQPKISVASNSLIGVEALVRWYHPTQGIIPPDDFIPLAEQAGLCKLLTGWVLNNALQQTAQWDREGLHISIAVNLSVKNLHDLEFPSQVIQLLKKWGIVPARLTLEITESAMLQDWIRVGKVVADLRKIGVLLSVDDYGTGYSSLSYLRRFPAQEIKIDKSFVSDMSKSKENIAFVKSTIDLIHNIGCKAVAEGVEDQQTMELLTHLGCDVIQGYHVCRPLAGDHLDGWLSASPWHPIRR